MNTTKSEVLRYLGYHGQALSTELDSMVERCIGECRENIKPLYTWQIFECRKADGAIALSGTPLMLSGEDIQKHLGQAEKTAVMAATLGVGVEHLIRRWSYSDLTRSVVLDACATQLIEEVCDQAEQEIKKEAQKEGFITNFRYSPGYGDLGLEIQPMLLEVLKAGKKIGLTCSDSLILQPRKSVTALIGFLPPGTSAIEPGGCQVCSLRDSCKFRKDGVPGGCNKVAAK